MNNCWKFGKVILIIGWDMELNLLNQPPTFKSDLLRN